MRRTAAEAAETRAAIVAAARTAFARDGFSGATLDSIGAAASVTRGAVRHHFADKTELFLEVFQRLEAELNEAVVTAALTADPSDRMNPLRAAVQELFAFMTRPDYIQLALTDAPSVLGLPRWYEIDRGYGIPTVRIGLEGVLANAGLPASFMDALTLLVFGGLTEVGLGLGTKSTTVTPDDIVDALTRIADALDPPPPPPKKKR